MQLNYYQLACDLWFVLSVFSVIGMVSNKPVARKQSAGSRVLEMGLTVLAFVLVFSNSFRSGWLGIRFLPHRGVAGPFGLLLTFLGVALSVAARLQLGGNWSGMVTIKQGHTLVRRGPYAIVRHPIYSGFLLAMFGVALTLGELRGLFAVGVLFLALWLKSETEERFMLQQFGQDYRQYKEEVNALIPFLY
jgi:protein-S-isoprenylcysteine O-methyltransferase Ste14